VKPPLSTRPTSKPSARPTAEKGGREQAIGPSRAGPTTKIHVLTDVIGRPGVIHLTPGNASDVKTAPAVLEQAPGCVRRLIADKGYDADWLRQTLREQGISVVIPGTRASKRKIRLGKWDCPGSGSCSFCVDYAARTMRRFRRSRPARP